MPVDKFGRMSDTKTKDTGVSLTYINNNYIRSDGTTLVSGSINMNGNNFYNVSGPVNPQDVATKEYVDDVEEKKKHLIIAHAKYCGLLKPGQYPFKFSGGDFETCDEFIENKITLVKGSTSGFLIPHSGIIKNIVYECIAYLKQSEIKKTILFDLLPDKEKDILKSVSEEEFLKHFAELLVKQYNEDYEIIVDTGTPLDFVKFEKQFGNINPSQPIILTTKTITRSIKVLQYADYIDGGNDEKIILLIFRFVKNLHTWKKSFRR